MVKHKGLWIALFIAPCAALFLLIYGAPIVTVLYTSLCEYTAFVKPHLIGFGNFTKLFADEDFLVSVKNTLAWVLLQTTFHVALGLLMALMLQRKPKGWQFVRTAYMIPNIIPTAATGVMFYMLLNPTFGIFKTVYSVFGIDPMNVPNFFGDSKFSFVTVTCTWIFYSAFNTIIFMAEMGAIPKEIYESARVDGAKPYQIDLYITLPLLKNIICTTVVLAAVAMVAQFDIIYVTTRGGPGNSTLNLPIYLYKTATLESNYGMANAVGVIQIFIGLALVLLVRKVFSIGEDKPERKGARK